jgi:predicted nuclease of restriction endonuclease-like (RecB) superfamily
MKKSVTIKPIDTTYQSVKQILEEARRKAYTAVNFAMVQAYWHIGRIIVEEEQRGKAKAGYGEYVLRELSERLTKDFGRGFDPSNLRYMRLFYHSFENMSAPRLQSADQAICDAVRHISPLMTKSYALRGELPFVRHELSWTHYRLLLKVERPDVRKFYMDECIAANWSTRQLERQINSFYYERLLSSRNKGRVRDEIKKLEHSPAPQDIIKDPYVLEFLGMRESRAYLERELEQGLINKLHDFLLELGKGFSFVARQKRITIDGDHFYIDLVFYNYFLKCFVLIDLKVGKLTHQDIGQMDFYARYFEKEIRLPEDNPTVGLILCAEKNEAMAKYTLLGNSKNVFASKYKLYLPTEKELKEELKREKMYLELEMRKSDKGTE